METKYRTAQHIAALVRSFEDASISREDWKHAEHLIVALYYLTHHDLDTATEKMRSGIFNLLSCGFNIDLTKEMPYHETLTVFWMRTVAAYIATTDRTTVVSRAAELVNTYDKDHPLKYYSRELLFSDEARRQFVDGDIGN